MVLINSLGEKNWDDKYDLLFYLVEEVEESKTIYEIQLWYNCANCYSYMRRRELRLLNSKCYRLTEILTKRSLRVVSSNLALNKFGFGRIGSLSWIVQPQHRRGYICFLDVLKDKQFAFDWFWRSLMISPLRGFYWMSWMLDFF